MAIAYVAGITANLGANGGTTSSVDSTGGNLVVVAVSSYDLTSAPTVSDSKGNTYNALTARVYAGSHRVQLFYAENATVGSGHTFTVTGSTSYASISVNVFSGAKSSGAFDQQNGAAGANSPASTGSVTPTEDNEVVVAGIALDSAPSGLSINGGFSTPAVAYFAGGSAYGVGSAYLIQTTATAANPAWSWTGGSQEPTAIATFRVAAAASTTRGTPFGARGTAFNGGRVFQGVLR